MFPNLTEDIIVSKFLPNIMMIGNGRIIANTIQSLIFSLYDIYYSEDSKENAIDIYSLINKIIRNKLTIMTNDDFIKSEIAYENIGYFYGPERFRSSLWEFYPFRNINMKIDRENNSDLFKIPTYILDTLNFENYVPILGKEKPDLIITMSEKAYKSVNIFNRVSNAVMVIDDKYHPQIISYAHQSDKFLIGDQMKKYFNTNLNRDEIVGFPSQIVKESKLGRDFVTANQFSSMIKSLYSPKDVEGELTLTLSEDTGSLARALIKLSRMKNF